MTTMGYIVSILDFVLSGHCETAAGGRGNLQFIHIVGDCFADARNDYETGYQKLFTRVSRSLKRAVDSTFRFISILSTRSFNILLGPISQNAL